jgi:hypothetical protein
MENKQIAKLLHLINLKILYVGLTLLATMSVLSVIFL